MLSPGSSPAFAIHVTGRTSGRNSCRSALSASGTVECRGNKSPRDARKPRHAILVMTRPTAPFRWPDWQYVVTNLTARRHDNPIDPVEFEVGRLGSPPRYFTVITAVLCVELPLYIATMGRSPDGALCGTVRLI